MNKKGKVYRRIYVFYLIIFAIPILLSVAFYFYVYNQIKINATDFNQNILEIVKSESDREIQSLKNVLVRLSFDRNQQQLSAMKGAFSPEDSYKIYSLKKELYNTMTYSSIFNSYCIDIFVYFRNSDKVVSAVGGAMNFKSYYELYCRNSAFTEQELLSYMSRFHFQDMILVKPVEEGQNPYFLLTLTNLDGGLGDTATQIGLMVDIDVLNYIIHAIKGEDGTEVLILDSDNQVINSTDWNYSLDYASLREGRAGETRIGGETYIIQSADSVVNDWKYVALTPKKQIEELAMHIRNVFFLGMSVCLIMGIVVSHRMTGSIYVLWENLMGLLHPYRRKGEDAGNDEYAYLQKQVLRLLEEHADFKQIISNDRRIVRQYYLIRLLEAPYDDQEAPEERDAASGNLKDGFNRVLLLHMDEKTEKHQNEEEFVKKNSLWKFIVGNVFTEGLSGYFKTEVAEVGNAVAAIVNIPGNFEEHQERLNETIDTLRKFIQDNFDFQVIVLMGRAHEGLLGINQSYQEARAAEGYVKILEEDCICYEDICSFAQVNYHYSIEMENKVISAMKSGNPILAISYVNHILDFNYLEHKISPMMFKCLMFDVMGTIMKCGNQYTPGADLLILIEEMDMKDVSVKMSLEELKERFEVIIKSMCPEAEPVKVEGKAAHKLVDGVIGYVNESFHEQDLNISQAGIHFHVTPAYLSAVFKKQTGISLLTYINQLRVDEAEKLLKSGLSVAETAERVGFRESSTFIRVFKKMTGATPGQIKT